jgi:hypothetical protein
VLGIATRELLKTLPSNLNVCTGIVEVRPSDFAVLVGFVLLRGCSQNLRE